MVESIRRIFLSSWFFWPGEGYFCTPQSYPPCQGLVGNLQWENGWDRTLFFLSRTHLEFFLRCHQGKILSRGELWGQVHTMDHAVATMGSRCAWANESVPYPAHKVGYQRFRETFGAKVSQLSTQIHSGGNGVPQHLLAWYGIPICYQNWAEIQAEDGIRDAVRWLEFRRVLFRSWWHPKKNSKWVRLRIERVLSHIFSHSKIGRASCRERVSSPV